jgi:hypothetical protein
MAEQIPRTKYSAFELTSGKLYRVTVPFHDYDGILHSQGESWHFLRKSFLPYEDGLSLFVEQAGQEVQIRLQCRNESQAQLVNDFSNMVEEV